eukprot:12689913-Heterocapsa_arctica.AAC.1
MNRNTEEIEKSRNEMNGINEKFAAVEMNPNIVIWPWLVRHSAWLIERFHVRKNGMPVLKWPGPLGEDGSYGHPKCHRVWLADGTWVLGNP